MNYSWASMSECPARAQQTSHQIKNKVKHVWTMSSFPRNRSNYRPKFYWFSFHYFYLFNMKLPRFWTCIKWPAQCTSMTFAYWVCCFDRPNSGEIDGIRFQRCSTFTQFNERVFLHRRFFELSFRWKIQHAMVRLTFMVLLFVCVVITTLDIYCNWMAFVLGYSRGWLYVLYINMHPPPNVNSDSLSAPLFQPHHLWLLSVQYSWPAATSFQSPLLPCSMANTSNKSIRLVHLLPA